MKQKIEFKVPMHGQKCRSKAMKIVVGFSGVESVAIKGEDKNQIEVIGEEVELVSLANLLKKKMGYAELLTVSAEGNEKKENESKENETKLQPLVWNYQGGVPYYELPAHYVSQMVDNDHESSLCSIM